MTMTMTDQWRSQWQTQVMTNEESWERPMANISEWPIIIIILMKEILLLLMNSNIIDY